MMTRYDIVFNYGKIKKILAFFSKIMTLKVGMFIQTNQQQNNDM